MSNVIPFPKQPKPRPEADPNAWLAETVGRINDAYLRAMQKRDAEQSR